MQSLLLSTSRTDVTDENKLVSLFSSLAERIETRYGPQSLAAAIVRTELLIALVQRLGAIPTEGQPHYQTVANLVGWLRKWYWSALSGALAFRAVRHTAEGLLEFDGPFYRDHFSAHGATIQSDLRVAGEDILSQLEPGRWYNYVLDESGDVIVHRRALPLRELVLTQPYSPERVVHPMLVHTTLRARTAGEITFVGRRFRVRGVIANTKSGHFLPPPATAKVLHALCVSRFGLRPSDVVVFAVRPQ